MTDRCGRCGDRLEDDPNRPAAGPLARLCRFCRRRAAAADAMDELVTRSLTYR